MKTKIKDAVHLVLAFLTIVGGVSGWMVTKTSGWYWLAGIVIALCLIEWMICSLWYNEEEKNKQRQQDHQQEKVLKERQAQEIERLKREENARHEAELSKTKKEARRAEAYRREQDATRIKHSQDDIKE